MLPLHGGPPPEGGTGGSLGGLRQRAARPSPRDRTPATDILLARRRGQRGGHRRRGGTAAAAAVIEMCRAALPAVLLLGVLVLAVWSSVGSISVGDVTSFLEGEGSSSSARRQRLGADRGGGRRHRRDGRRREDLEWQQPPPRDLSDAGGDPASDGEPYRPKRREHLVDERTTTGRVVYPDRLAFETVTCGDGTGPFPLNDGYCDCPDGMDETGTSACSHLLVQKRVFHCGGGGDDGVAIFASRVGDGIRDCEDGSDET